MRQWPGRFVMPGGIAAKWACDLLLAAESLGVFCVGVICGVIDVFG